MARSILTGVAEIEGIIASLLDYTRETAPGSRRYALAASWTR